MKELVGFQSENKYLLTVYDQKELRVLGRIVANQENKPFNEIIKSYKTHPYYAFRRAPNIGAKIDVLARAEVGNNATSRTQACRISKKSGVCERYFLMVRSINLVLLTAERLHPVLKILY